MLYAIYGTMLCVYVGIVLVTGLISMLRFHFTGTPPHHLR